MFAAFHFWMDFPLYPGHGPTVLGQGDIQAKGSGLSLEWGPCLFLKKQLPKKIPQKHTLI